jgi:hypothetical protein
MTSSALNYLPKVSPFYTIVLGVRASTYRMDREGDTFGP